MGATKMRMERLGDERDRTASKLQDLIDLAEDEKRSQSEGERAQATKYREQIAEYEEEIILLASDVERQDAAVDVSRVLRSDEGDGEGDGESGIRRYATPRSNGPSVYRSFAEYARDKLITDEKFGSQILPLAGGDPNAIRMQAEERLERTLQNVTSTTVAGLINPTHMTDILDIIDRSRPVVDSGRDVPLDRGSMTYPVIGTRPSVILQSAEKTEAGTVAPTVSSSTLTANTYLGAVNISWQALNWSNPDVLALYLDLAAEAYARQTESVACEAMETSAIGTVGTASGRLGTAGTESFGQWRAAVIAGLSGINTATVSRHRTNTLYLSANRFYQLAALGTDQVVQMSPIGSLDVGSMTGNFFGLRVIGSHGFDQDTAIIGDSGALLIGENAGSPVDLRVVEPRIGGYEVGLIGAFNAVVFDVNRFFHLGTHL
jgi:HK97 family phage major capsid protein